MLGLENHSGMPRPIAAGLVTIEYTHTAPVSHLLFFCLTIRNTNTTPCLTL